MSLKSISLIFALFIGLLVLGSFVGKSGGKISAEIAKNTKVTVYKTVTCGCCANYVSYLKRAGFDVEVKNVNDLNEIKLKYGVPGEVQSCHTSVVGNYVVEGHIPMEAISKLMNERPAIAGIGMPGMPAGSPGMPGAKTLPFTIWSFDQSGKTSEFMSI